MGWGVPILLNAKSPKLDPNIVEGLDQWPKNTPLRVQPTLQELIDAIRSLKNRTTAEPDGVSVGLFKITLNGNPALRRRPLDMFVVGGEGGAAALLRGYHHGTPHK